MLSLVLNYVIKHCAIKAYGGVEVQLYVIFTEISELHMKCSCIRCHHNLIHIQVKEKGNVIPCT
jgi:hypothetical protein